MVAAVILLAVPRELSRRLDCTSWIRG